MLKGSIVALVTPMNKFGEIDYEGLGKLIDFHLLEKTDGLLVLGTTDKALLFQMRKKRKFYDLR